MGQNTRPAIFFLSTQVAICLSVLTKHSASLNECSAQNSSEETWGVRPSFPARPPTDFTTLEKMPCYSLPPFPPEENCAHSILKYVLNHGDLKALVTSIEPYFFQTCCGKDNDGGFPP